MIFNRFRIMVTRRFADVNYLKAGMIAAYLMLCSSWAFADTAHFLTLSDIHFDPFRGCKGTRPCALIRTLNQSPVSSWPSLLRVQDKSLPIIGQDTNYPLWTAMLNLAKDEAQLKQVKFVVVLGDWLAHDFKRSYKRYSGDHTVSGYQQFVRKTLTFLGEELQQAFPDINIYGVIGNNDSDGSDYYSVIQGDFFKQTAIIWSHLIRQPESKRALLSSFSVGGYYALDLPSQPELRLIVLNSVLFSYKAKGKNIEAAAIKQLDWLKEQLEVVRRHHQKALIAMHIPVGIDLYATRRVRLFTLLPLWDPEYAHRYQMDLQEFSSDIMGVLAGHLHADWFQFMSYQHLNDMAVTVTPSISPVYGNNPGFKIYRYSTRSLILKGFDTFNYLMPSSVMLRP